MKDVHLNSPLNVLMMTTSQWVCMLTEDGLTMETIQANHQRQYIPCRTELASPTTDWDLCWRLCRLMGVGSELASFSFQLLHGLFVTKKRAHQYMRGPTATCSHCADQVDEDLQQAFIDCSYNCGVGQSLLRVAQIHIPEISTPLLFGLSWLALKKIRSCQW